MAVDEHEEGLSSATSFVAVGLENVKARMVEACARARRDPRSVRLIAVSKTWPAAYVRAAYHQGQREFGENYVQELTEKAAQLADLKELRWHLIGHLQRNKAKDVVRVGADIDTIDSSALAEAVARRAHASNAKIEVMIQVNVGKEPQKSGCAPEEVPLIVETIQKLSALHLVGLMTVPPVEAEEEDTRKYFRELVSMARSFGLKEISMGMSHDFEIAIEEGATLIRVGSAIFGQRAASK